MDQTDSAPGAAPRSLGQMLVALGALLVGAVLAVGATFIPAEAGYAGVGPNFLPWLVAVAMVVCGVLLGREALTGGFRAMDEPSGAARGDWTAFAWVSAGVLANAALITSIGFVLSCALCFTLAVRGLRSAEGRPAGSPAQTGRDAAIGLTIALPVFWLFTKVLAINLPGVSGTGWI
jgi:putative tricarboxylic transport membrane protein